MTFDEIDTALGHAGLCSAAVASALDALDVALTQARRELGWEGCVQVRDHGRNVNVATAELRRATDRVADLWLRAE